MRTTCVRNGAHREVLRRKEPMTDEPTKDELLERARELDVAGRSSMDKSELAEAIAAAEGAANDVQADQVESVGQHLIGYPDAHTVDEIAEATSLDPDHVRTILDEYRPDGEGGYTHEGPGQGGPWIELPEED